MYKFTNGVVVFTEEDKKRFIEAGYVLVEEKDKTNEKDNKSWSVAKEHKRSDEESGRVHKGFK